jgi:hypothetical protein
MYIGLAATSHDAALTTTARFTNVSITGGAGVWGHQDIGIKSNIAGPLYVALQDSTLSKTAVITHPDPNAALNGTYQEWNIPLSSFTGINPAAIKKIFIGVGNRSSPTPGGAGTIYIDDIRVYRPRCFPGLIKPPADFDNSCIVDYPDIQTLTNNWLISTYDVVPAAPSDANLAVYYRFEGNFNDSSVNGNHGDPCNGVSIVTDPTRGQVANFDGVDDYVDITNPIELPLYSVALWFRVAGGTGSRDLFAAFTTNHGALLEVQGTGTLRYLHRFPFGGTGGNSIYTATGYADGLWHHAAAVKSADRMALYVDGQQVGAQTDNTQFDQPTMAVLGRIDSSRTERQFLGAMDDVRIYSRALSHNEVAHLAGKTTPFQQRLDLLLTPQDAAINLYNDKIIDLKDYAVLADTWLDELLWPQ